MSDTQNEQQPKSAVKILANEVADEVAHHPVVAASIVVASAAVAHVVTGVLEQVLG